MIKVILSSIVLGLLFIGCKRNNDTLFQLLPSSKTGVDFNNHIFEDEEINIIKLEYVYNGGGVAVGDFNNDGLSDLFFTGNMVDNALYLNKGNLKFEDVTKVAGIQGSERWKSGVALIDINEDGLLDIYVCATIDAKSINRTNMLFVNMGNNEDGIPVFEEQADAYGIADDSYSSNAVFFDYDNDQDLDLYILVNSKQYGVPTVYRPKITDGSSPLTDKLFRNNGDGTFTDVSRETGINIEGHGLGISILDINQDGWSDIYVANDFLTNDILYLNHNGVFVDEIDTYFKHQSKFSMGTDVADINNDGYQDLITVDMMPEINLRKKTVIQGGMYINYINDAKFNYTHQYTRNMLQLNNAAGAFSEIGQFAGVHQTEWSWSPLLADFDNDGYRDLLITNGFPKDITDKDFINYRMQVNNVASASFLDSQMPSVKVPNYAFKNNGDATFTDVSKQWGMTTPSFSNGAAYADLDNDGDLDYIVNNIYDKAFIYKNTLDPLKDKSNLKANFLRLKIKGPAKNSFGLGTKMALYSDNNVQYHEHTIYRGYISTVEDIVHFGLNETVEIDSLVILWPDKMKSTIISPEVNKVLQISYDNIDKTSTSMTSLDVPDFDEYVTEANDKTNISFIQPPYDIVDYSYQRTIPHKFTEFGPAISVGDINGDQLEDFIVGSFTNSKPLIYYQKSDGTFYSQALDEEDDYADGGMLLFDADNDGDLDLYIVSSGFLDPANHIHYKDRFFRNENGNFVYEEEAIPSITSSGSIVRAADFDGDGDLDLFVGGRVIPHAYPYAAKSYLLINNEGTFIDATDSLAPGLSEPGMITDAIWSDYDNDGSIDLIVVGEFMSVTIFKNTGRSLELLTGTGLEEYSGWWNSITGADFDNDGDIDYVVGNLGLNNAYGVTKEHPIYVYALDIDNNKSVDAVLACYYKFDDGTYQLCPVNYWEELSQQSPAFRKRFKSYSEFGMATIDSLFTPEELEASYKLKSNYFSNSYIENLSNGQFKISPLPLETQIAPLNGMITYDLNDDGNMDLLAIGNDFANEVAVGNLNGLNGLILMGKGDGTFKSVGNGLGGFYVPGDGKALVNLLDEHQNLILASQNKDALKVFEPISEKGKVIKAKNYETAAIVEYNDGTLQRHEFYYGSGFLSQSSRALRVHPDVKSVVLMIGNNISRRISMDESL